jgi:hypothetical protein
MVEIMCTVVILAVLAAAALPYVETYIGWAQQVWNHYELTVLNEGLTAYQTSGGMRVSHSLQGLNNAAEVGAVLNALKTGVTLGGVRCAFIAPNSNVDPTQLYAQGQGDHFSFVGYGTGLGMYGTGGDGMEGNIMATLAADDITPVSGLGAWIGTAQAAANNTSNYLLLTQPSSSTVIGFYVEGTGTLSINWGDGNTNTYSLNGSPQAISHTFGSAGTYGVTLVGNVTYFESNQEAGIGGANATCFGGNISTMTGLTYLNVQGSNTLSGNIANLTGLTYLWVWGSNTISGSITNLTGLTYLQVTGNNTLSGSITNLTGLTYLSVAGSNTLSGLVTNRIGLTHLYVLGSNTLSGDITNLTGLTWFQVSGSNTLSGSVAGLTSSYFIYVAGLNTITGWETVAANATGLCYLEQRGNTVLTSTQVNAVLAGFRANSAVSRSTTTNRTIDVANPGNGAPTGQGITDKAYLQGTITPPGSTYWTVNTN